MIILVKFSLADSRKLMFKKIIILTYKRPWLRTVTLEHISMNTKIELCTMLRDTVTVLFKGTLWVLIQALIV